MTPSTVRHSYDKGKNKGAIHMVSAWANQNRLVLGQVKVNEKSNEITAIPQLLKVLEIKDRTRDSLFEDFSDLGTAVSQSSSPIWIAF